MRQDIGIQRRDTLYLDTVINGGSPTKARRSFVVLCKNSLKKLRTNMNSRATMMLALVSILAAALLFTVGDACEGVPSMSIEAACHSAASMDEAMHNLCLRTLHSSSPPDNKIST